MTAIPKLPKAGNSFALQAFEDVTPVGDTAFFGRVHKDALSTRGLRVEAKSYLRNLVRQGQEGPKFLILSRARSGSTLLCRLLNQVPDIHCELEMMHYKIAFPRLYLNQLARKRKAPVHGSKLLSYQMVLVQQMRDPEGFLADLVEDGFRFIHLRRNSLSQVTSICAASQTGVYFRERTRAKVAKTMRLDPQDFVTRARWNLALLEFETRVLAQFPHDTVDYETDLARPEAHQPLIDRICPAVGAIPAPVEAQMKRVLEGGFDQIVENADDVRRAAENAGLGGLFEPGS